MIPVQIRFTEQQIKYIDNLVERGIYSNRSAAIRALVCYFMMGIQQGLQKKEK